MKVFLLGSTGLIGNHTLRELLKNGYNVRVLVRKTSNKGLLEGLNIEIFEGDINEMDSLIAGMRGCQIVIHCAGYYPRFSISEKSEKGKALKETRNVMEANLRAGVSKLLYVSSIGTIGMDESGMGKEETIFDYRKNKGIYHRIKFLMEEEVKKYSNQGVEVVIVNPTYCVGEYETKPLNYCLIPRIVKGMPFYIDGKTNAVDVKDVSKGIILALEKGRPSERYILGGENLTIKEFLLKIAKLAHVSPPFIRIPYNIAILSGYISEMLSFYIFKKYPLIPLSGIYMAKYSFYVSTEKAERELGFKPSPVDEGIKRALDWFKKIGYI